MYYWIYKKDYFFIAAVIASEAVPPTKGLVGKVEIATAAGPPNDDRLCHLKIRAFCNISQNFHYSFRR